MEQLAQDRILLELGERLDELGQRGGVLEDDADRGFRQACVVLGELGNVVREATLENRMSARGLALVERAPGRRLEVLEVFRRDLARDHDVPDVANDSVGREGAVDEDVGGL